MVCNKLIIFFLKKWSSKWDKQIKVALNGETALNRPTARYSFSFHVFVSGANEDDLKKVKHAVQYGVSSCITWP